MNKNHIFGTSCGFLSGILWGLDTVLTGIVLSMSPFIDGSEAITIAPIVSALLHDTFSSIWMMIYFFLKGELVKTIKLIKTRSGKFICIGAIFGGPVGMAAYLLAINLIGPGYTASISAIYPVVGAFFSYILLKEKLSARGWIGLTISIIAILILGYSGQTNIGNKFIIGFISATVCVLGWSLESVICAYGMKDDEVSPTQALQIRQVVSALFYALIIVPLVGGIELTKIAIVTNVVSKLIGVALIGTLSYIFYYMAIDKIGSVKATGLNVTYSIWAIVFEIILLGNTITIKLIISAILIAIGSVFISKN